MSSADLLNVSFGDKFVFFLLSSAIVAFALLTITRRNPVAAVMSLVATFFALSGLYASMDAHFLAVLQVIVYAGAIMVLFIFVVMILNRDEVEPVSFKGIITRAFGVLAMGYVCLVFARVVVVGRGVAALRGAPGPVSADYGTVAGVGNTLFRDFVYPFEAISLLLLVAIVGGIILSRSAKQEEESEEAARRIANVRLAIRPESRLGAVPGGASDNHGAAHAAHH